MFFFGGSRRDQPVRDEETSDEDVENVPGEDENP
jgi:hypothetical protein